MFWSTWSGDQQQHRNRSEFKYRKNRQKIFSWSYIHSGSPRYKAALNFHFRTLQRIVYVDVNLESNFIDSSPLLGAERKIMITGTPSESWRIKSRWPKIYVDYRDRLVKSPRATLTLYLDICANCESCCIMLLHFNLPSSQPCVCEV